MGIALKMVAAMKAIDAVEKKGKNQQQGYNYVRATDVANEVRKVLHELGIAFAYDIEDISHWDGQTKSGGTVYFCQIIVRVSFTDSETGETVSGRTVGWGTDSLDKAPYKAMTGALKYALRMFFLIPDELDPENEKEVVELAGKPKLIPKLKADSLRSQLVEKKVDPKKVRETLQAFGFMSCSEITEDRYQDVKDALDGVA